MSGVFIRRGAESQRPRHTKGEGPVTVEAEMELCSCKLRNAKYQQPPPEAKGKAWNRFSPKGARESIALLTL